jgi:glycosyltransferase involved in cell wall biosynthesis
VQVGKIMKILFLTNIPSPYRVHFFEELSKSCELTVLYEKRNASDRNDSWIYETKQKKPYQEIYMKALIAQSSSAFCPQVTQYLNKEEYDLIIVGVYSTLTGMYAILNLKIRKIPYVISCDGGITCNTVSLKAKLKKFFFGKAQAFLSTGTMCDEYIMCYGGDKSRIYHYPFTSLHEKNIDTRVVTVAEREKLRQELSMTEDKIIISVGQFIYRKGYDILLEAANQMKDAYGIYIIGGEPTKEYLDLKDKYHLEQVHFIDFKTKEELQSYYHAADLFVLPTREDIWGLVINEAMAAGLPVITTTKCVAGMELIKNKKCLIPSDDKDTLAEAIQEIMEQEDTREAIAIENLTAIREYTFENMAKRHMEIFEEIIRTREKINE